MRVFIVLVPILLGFSSLSAQLSVEVQTGYWYDFYDMDISDDYLISGWKGIKAGGIANNNRYLLLGLHYNWVENFRIGAEVATNGRSIVVRPGGEFREWSFIGDFPSFDMRIRGSHFSILSSVMSLRVGSGVGLEKSYCECSGREYVIAGSGGGGVSNSVRSLKAVYQTYIRHGIRWYLPLDAGLQFAFNNFLKFSLNIGYEFTINRRSRFLDYEIFVDDLLVESTRVYPTDMLSLGVGVTYYLPFKTRR